MWLQITSFRSIKMTISIQPPVVNNLPNQSKKKKKKEPITRRDTKSVTDVNKSTKEETGMVHKLADSCLQ